MEGLSTLYMEDDHKEKNQVWSKEVINDFSSVEQVGLVHLNITFTSKHAKKAQFPP